MPAPARSTPLATTPDLPADPGTLYPEDDGFRGRRAKARRAKLLRGIEDVLRRALAPGETIRYAARGIRSDVWEHMFGGAAVAQYHNMMALVLTDRRLLLVHVGRSGKAGDIKNELPLAAIHGARKRFNGIVLQLADGSKMRFGSVAGADGKRLAALLPGKGGPKTTERSLVHLCPACLRPVPGPVGTALVCPQQDCRIPFRDPRKAARLSALVPGLGDLYLRHHFFGSLEFLGSMMMLGFGIAFGLEAAFSGDRSGIAVAAGLVLAFIAVPRVIDYLLTLHMGRKGLVPLALAPAPGAQARNLPSYPRWSALLFVAGISVTGGVVALTSPDLRAGAAVREAAALAAQGRLDEAHTRWAALEREGGVSDERRVRFALALLEAGDLEGAGALEEQFQGKKVEARLAERWNAAQARERAALEGYQQGLKALVAGDASAWARLDPALAYFRAVKRPHLPGSRGELQAHLAESALREPLGDADLDRARPWLDGAGDAPAAELAVVRAAYDSAAGRAAEARSTLAAIDAASLPVTFRLLALEARARLVEGDADRAALRKAAEALPHDDLDSEEAARLDAVLARTR